MGGEARERELARGGEAATQRDFEHAQKLETLGMLACGVAHDFNNLLVAILGNAGLALQDLEANARARPQVEEIRRAALRAAELTEQVLTYAGRGREPVQVIDLNAAISEMTELLRVSIPQTTELDLELAAEAARVEADPSQIRQVLMNLILNAAQSLPDQRGHVHIETRSQDDLIILEVSDTGSGMDASILAKIFDPFFTTRKKGSGLGLAAAKRIIERTGGQITVQSKPGKGSKFSIRLPRTESQLPDLSDDSESAIEFVGHGQILVIDAEESVRRMVSSCLTRHGFEVHGESDLSRALQLCEDLDGDLRLVILDLGIGNKTGREALHAIRRTSADLPVMLSSGLGSEAAQDIEGVIFNSFLPKPYSPEQLLAAVQQALPEDAP